MIKKQLLTKLCKAQDLFLYHTGLSCGNCGWNDAMKKSHHDYVTQDCILVKK